MSFVLLGLIWISPPFLKKLWLRWFCAAKIGRGARIGWFSAVLGRQVELGEASVIRPLTVIHLSGQVKLGRYSEISSFNLVYGSSSLLVGDECYIGPQCLINAEEPVRMGHGSALGPRSMVFTHGSFLPYTEGYWSKLSGVTLGDKVWCAAGVFIHPGVEIGDDTFVNARSVVTQSIPAGSLVEGNPAKVIGAMDQARRNMSPRRVDLAMARVLRDFAEIGLRRELRVSAIDESEGRLCFRWKGRAYCVALIPSTGGQASAEPGVRLILVSNYPGWPPPAGALVFDLPSRQTRFVSDPIHTALRVFMLRYYGIRFHAAGDGLQPTRI